MTFETEIAEDGTEYKVAVPLSLEKAYANIMEQFEVDISSEIKDGSTEIYSEITAGGASFSGEIMHGNGGDNEIDISGFSDPTTKNSTDLVAYAEQAWENQWGYVWGTCGWVLTDSMYNSKLAQYPSGVGNYSSFILENWLGRRTTDCVGLIKGYGWLDTESLEVAYGTNGMPDIDADQMYNVATVKGDISTIPEIPGLAVWNKGHIGVYIGNGEVIEAMGTKYGVVKTKLADRNFTAWLEIPYINY